MFIFILESLLIIEFHFWVIFRSKNFNLPHLKFVFLSMLILLRCQVHMEIARIEEDGDRIEAAVEHLQKAMRLNHSGQYQEHLRLTFNRLNLHTMLYKSPERLEDRAVIMIEQVIRKNKVSSLNRFAD